MSTTTTPRIPPCCLRTPPPWPTSPTGTTTTLTTPLKQHSVYTAGDNPTRAILVIHDLLGWTFPNLRLLADSYAHSANATVFLPDFFGGETLPAAPILAGRWAELDLQGFLARNARAIREPEVVAFAQHLRMTLGFERVGVVGYCWGGWAAVRLGGLLFDCAGVCELGSGGLGGSSCALGEGGSGSGISGSGGRGRGDGDGAGQQQYLVDCVSIGHPSLLTEEDIAAVQVPVQVLAPERDPVFTPRLKTFTIRNLQERGVEFEYRFFPGVEHGCFTRGDEGVAGEREALGRGREAVGCWMGGWL